MKVWPKFVRDGKVEQKSWALDPRVKGSSGSGLEERITAIKYKLSIHPSSSLSQGNKEFFCFDMYDDDGNPAVKLQHLLLLLHPNNSQCFSLVLNIGHRFLNRCCQPPRSKPKMKEYVLEKLCSSPPVELQRLENQYQSTLKLFSLYMLTQHLTKTWWVFTLTYDASYKVSLFFLYQFGLCKQRKNKITVLRKRPH